MALLNQGINMSGVGILALDCNGQDARSTPDAHSKKLLKSLHN